MIDVGRPAPLLRELPVRKNHDFDAPEPVIVEKLDHVAFPDVRRRLHPQAIDLDLPSAAGLGRLLPMFEEADMLEPVVDSMAFHKVLGPRSSVLGCRRPTEDRGPRTEDGIIPVMIKADIVNKVAEVSEISRVKAAQAVDTVIEGLRNALARGQRIELRGFGVFQVKQRKKGIGRNPKTGVEVKIPPGNTIRFKPGKELRNLL